jgi:C1A family cysteine protease
MRFGWLPDYPDNRDYTKDTNGINEMLKEGIGKPGSVGKAGKAESVGKVDLREFCSPIVNQGELGSCTANAASGIVEYFQNKAFGTYTPVSRLFVYKATRNLMKMKGDSGAYIRSTMGALALFGAPPEKYLEYDIERFDIEPPAFCYSFAQNYQAIKYFRLDEQKLTETEILASIKQTLNQNVPAMFGFTVYSSINRAIGGKIPFPERADTVLGGHAVAAIGYDDSMKIGSSTGAFIIRNSWGTEWGDKGYGYLPYDYVLNGLAMDWWSIINERWLDTKGFGV